MVRQRHSDGCVTCTKSGCLGKECKGGTFHSHMLATSSPQALFEASQWDNKQMTDKERFAKSKTSKVNKPLGHTRGRAG